MITFITSLVILLLGYLFYGKFVDKTFKSDPTRETPAHTLEDGVDYVPMNSNRNAFIQILNIAGVGPIFGPILGALYGPSAFLWIVFGSIFAGGVHDYLTGMISLRYGGAHLPELASRFLGKYFSHIVNFFILLLLVLVGTVFVTAPAKMINELMNSETNYIIPITFCIFIYYIIATLLPIDKVIGKIYPVLGFLLLLSAVGICGGMFISGNPIPELTLENLHPKGTPYYPVIFLTISCGALSGFHASQSPIISRTMDNEKDGRKVFYGMMILEAFIAMIWAAATMSLMDGDNISQLLASGGPAAVVNEIAVVFLGTIGGTIAVIGIIVLPITSGDTSFRAARMIIADYLKIDQKTLKNRFIVAIPLFIISYILTNMDFQLLWRYFSWSNQVSSAIALWIGTIYLYQNKKYYIIALAPAFFITSVIFSYLFYDPTIGFGLDVTASNWIGLTSSILITILFFVTMKKREKLVQKG
ncbi:carbon starvation protein, predicted membrane protein [Bernardetia litoralis DSM 6794]|uniref:Carbon starvation protein, predicted membrane protein n=1 Tax=Bernardetia litoralis (strain ATCC 23117 / DSM 6794 / NBRC 15988 / NCIMB 1366 / Fx l1 / Sio-4) TaxID=880071 RepID=I4AR00_BERLS|nr:carbon starvation CstA family protein [Bernardetia litoralis]AFM06385.1 carbon starvation protein, predicted membrane protein [Bernardetia litoralis DSM 6794]